MTAGGHPPARVAGGARFHAARYAVYTVFTGAGFAFASWASRIPQVRGELRVSPGVLGLILLCLSAGTTIATPLSGLIVARLGEARTVAAMSLVAAAGLGVVAVGYVHGVPPVAAGLFLFGFGAATWDVAMNVQGAAVEQALGRAIMPRFHAGWSIGTVAGAAVGAAMVALGVPVSAHLLAVALTIAVAMPVAARSFLPRVQAAQQPRPAPQPGPATGPGPAPQPGPGRDAPAGPDAREGAPRCEDTAERSPLMAWTELRTLLLGLFVLCMTFTEGAGNDWLSLAVISGYHTRAVTGTLTLAVFLAAMTGGRWAGPRFLDRYGRVRVLRACAATAVAGLLLVGFGSVVPMALAGAALMGLGTSLGFPVGLSAAADDPRYAPGRVSAAASIGYGAFLAGPPLIGFLADHVGVKHSLFSAGVLLAVAFVLARVTAPAGAGPGLSHSRDMDVQE